MKYKYYRTFILLLFAFYLTVKVKAQNATVRIDINCERFIGDESELDRTKYFNVHDASSDSDATTFRNDYNVTGGRQFWGPYGYAFNASSNTASERRAGVYPGDRPGNNDVRDVKEGWVMTSHPRTAFLDGLDLNAAADWAVEYFKDYESNGNALEFFEVMNEPFVHADDFYSGGWNSSENDRIKLQMAQFYNEVAKRISDSPALANMKVVGYSSAWPSMELNDFGHWEENMKMFMDTAGDNMYGFSTHLYDGINITGQDTKRSGSNSEAILDLIENYSFIKWGAIKPHAITEYGAIEKGYGPDYSEIASSQTMISINHILFNLLDRQDRLANSIPFMVGKATWHITAANNYQPYTPALWIPTNIGDPTPAGWKYSPRIMFYELWKDVKGKRVLIKSDNPDIQTHAFVDGNKMYVALSNLDENEQTVDLQMISDIPNFVDVKTKALKVYVNAMPDLSINTTTTAPSTITLIKDETVVLEYNFSDPVVFDNALRAKNYYTLDYLQAINANTPIIYNFNDVTTGDGYATLRMSIGRKHNVSKQPIVKVNGQNIPMPVNWRGYDQVGRDDFFGMIDIPFPANVLNTNNEVSIEFPDSGGRISSLILTVEKFDTAKNRVSVLSSGNACPDQNNGAITVNPLIQDNYQVHVTGNGVDATYDFSARYSIEDLATGTYDVTVTSTTDASVSLKYTVVIDEPENLSVLTKVDKSKSSVSLNLKGGQLYRINLNGALTITDKSQVTLQLSKGSNNLEVTTNKDCQGQHKQDIFLFDRVTVAPTVVDNQFTIAFPDSDEQIVTYQVISSTGQVVLQKSVNRDTQNLVIGVQGLTAGLYFVNVVAPNVNSQSKIIKK
ncbi:T9SS type A sorting domain-containing protein [Flavivirga eckloniae]|uniref:Carbohydrate-binding protein n=1 Tax=Flavivirga eckloniae TaxID=1803846 RepID=A0A2K9PVP4_9FLAO|nr:T9SS type A sorting domain-containing protein [Flavivirga eckloniae]AUP80577.1 carbohydrate-binding protein [Flavivirga eckloniae]